MNTRTTDGTILEAFDLIRQYAERRGWIPIGRREFVVGEWEIKVNGSKDPWEDVPPFHAHVHNRIYVGSLLLSPLSGLAVGYKGTEPEFIAAMKAAVTPA